MRRFMSINAGKSFGLSGRKFLFLKIFTVLEFQATCPGVFSPLVAEESGDR